jgi:hypothetical protein
LEDAVEQIRRNRQVMFAVGGHDEFALPSGFDAVFLHEPPNPFFPNQHAISLKLLPDSWPAVFAFAGQMRCLDVNQQGGITEAPARQLRAINIFAPLTFKEPLALTFNTSHAP